MTIQHAIDMQDNTRLNSNEETCQNNTALFMHLSDESLLKRIDKPDLSSTQEVGMQQNLILYKPESENVALTSDPEQAEIAEEQADEVIEIPEQVTFLSEIMQSLPSKCIFNKGKTGCGGTYIALHNDENYIIAVPSIELIINKAEQENKHNICCVYDRYSATRVKRYQSGNAIQKYLVTYNSLEKLINTIGDVSGFKILIDEQHLLFTQYGFRDNAINNILNNYNKFGDYCFMSATPLRKEFQPDELVDIRTVTAIWEKDNSTSVANVKCKCLFSTVRAEIRKFIKNENDGNAYFFINSIRFIEDLIFQEGLTEDNTRVICAKKHDTIEGIPNSSLHKKNIKKINLLTSTAFEGSDIDDEDGKTYIISDPTMDHRLTDISTSFIQICGRIRNSKYNNMVVHLYSKTFYNGGTTYREFKTLFDEETSRIQKITKELNQLSDITKHVTTLKDFDETLIRRDSDGNYFFNKNRHNHILFNFMKTVLLYGKDGALKAELEKHGFEVTEYISEINISRTPRKQGNEKLTDILRFIEQTTVIPSSLYGHYNYMIEYEEEEMKKINTAIDECLYKNPELKDALNLFDFEKCIELAEVSPENLRRKTNKEKYSSSLILIQVTLIDEGLIKLRQKYTGDEIRAALEKAYKIHGIRKNAKAEDITKIFNTRPCQKNRQRAFVILSPKTIAG